MGTIPSKRPINWEKEENDKSLLNSSSLQLKEKIKTNIEDLEQDLQELEQDEDFRLDDNTEWIRQKGFIKCQITFLQNL